LNELVDVVINSGAKLFVCAVGVAPKPVIDKLHAAGIYYMVQPSLDFVRYD
jgi:NAD(P)H-dependent flavin oxidoreductase YrpB (nitropropane dioxygenase family)